MVCSSVAALLIELSDWLDRKCTEFMFIKKGPIVENLSWKDMTFGTCS